MAVERHADQAGAAVDDDVQRVGAAGVDALRGADQRLRRNPAEQGEASPVIGDVAQLEDVLVRAGADAEERFFAGGDVGEPDPQAEVSDAVRPLDRVHSRESDQYSPPQSPTTNISPRESPPGSSRPNWTFPRGPPE